MARDRDPAPTGQTDDPAVREREERFARGDREAGGLGPPAQRGRGRGGSGALPWVLGVAVLIAMGLAVWAWVDDSAGPEQGVTIDDVAENPEDFAGQTVTVSGRVDAMVRLGAASAATGEGEGAGTVQAEGSQAPGGSSVAFVLGDSSAGDQVLVVGADAPYTFLREGRVVQVTGTVRVFDADRFDEGFGFSPDDEGWFDVDFFADWDERAAIVAHGVDPTVEAAEAS